MPTRLRMPRDVNELAHAIGAAATGETRAAPADARNPAAVALGLLGGARGGKARAKGMTKAQRSEAARTAALARWGKKRKRKLETVLESL